MLIHVVQAEPGQVAEGLVTGLVGDHFYALRPERDFLVDLADHAREQPDWQFTASGTFAPLVCELVTPARFRPA